MAARFRWWSYGVVRGGPGIPAELDGWCWDLNDTSGSDYLAWARDSSYSLTPTDRWEWIDLDGFVPAVVYEWKPR